MPSPFKPSQLSPEMVERDHPEVKLIRAGANLGFAKANNLAMQRARGTQFALVNSDALVHPGCLEALSEHMDRHPDVGLAGPRVLGGQGGLQRSCRHLPGLRNTLCRALALDRVFGGRGIFSGYEVSSERHELLHEPEVLSAKLVERVKQAYAVKESVEVPDALGALERYVVINAIDHHWQEHLTEMENLRQSVGLRSYGQKDPLVEYKSEAYKYFEELMTNVRLQICTGLFRSASNIESFENMLSLLSRTARAVGPADAPATPRLETSTTVTGGGTSEGAPEAAPEIQLPKVTIRRETPKVGRNDPCPCGSGKKFKACHGA